MTYWPSQDGITNLDHICHFIDRTEQQHISIEVLKLTSQIHNHQVPAYQPLGSKATSHKSRSYQHASSKFITKADHKLLISSSLHRPAS
jgi:hypothetical protein